MQPTARSSWCALPVFLFPNERPTPRTTSLRQKHFSDVVKQSPTASETKKLRNACHSLIQAFRQGRYVTSSQDLDLSAVGWPGTESAALASRDKERNGFAPTWTRPSKDRVCDNRGRQGEFCLLNCRPSGLPAQPCLTTARSVRCGALLGAASDHGEQCGEDQGTFLGLVEVVQGSRPPDHVGIGGHTRCDHRITSHP